MASIELSSADLFAVLPTGADTYMYTVQGGNVKKVAPRGLGVHIYRISNTLTEAAYLVQYPTAIKVADIS